MKVKRIAEKHGKTISQIGIRWAVQIGVVTIPKSTHTQRIKDNLNSLPFVPFISLSLFVIYVGLKNI